MWLRRIYTATQSTAILVEQRLYADQGSLPLSVQVLVVVLYTATFYARCPARGGTPFIDAHGCSASVNLAQNRNLESSSVFVICVHERGYGR